MKVVAYARFSSDNQREESIDAQMRAINEYCSKNNHVLIGQYVDIAVSATTDQREQFQQMIDDSSKGLFEGVVVHKLDRFARNRYDSVIYSKRLQNNNVVLLSVLENLDNSPESVIFRSIIEGYNEYYSLNLARETKKGLKENALKSKHCGGLPPLGFDIDKEGNYIINEVEAKAVRLIFNMYLSEEGYSPIINSLNAAGFRTKRGSKFGKNSLYDILGNEKYKGTYSYGKIQKKINGRRNTSKIENENFIIIENAIPRIIDDNTFNKVQEIRKKNKRTLAGRLKAKRMYLLSGLLKCGECGGAMTGSTSVKKGVEYGQYLCANSKIKKTSCAMKSISQSKIEDLVVRLIQNDIIDAVKDKEKFKELLRGLDSGIEVLNDQLLSIEKTLKDKDKEINNIVEAISKGISSEALLNKLQTLEAEKAIINSEMIKLREKSTHQILTEDDLVRIKDLWEIKKTPQDLRSLITLLVEKVTLGKNGVKISYQIPSASGDPKTKPAPVRITITNAFV